MSCVSAFVPAYLAADRLPGLIHALRTFADEIVVAVDDRSTDGTAEIAAALADRTTRFRHDGTFARVFREMFRCRGEWIVRFDDDERPSPGWTRERVRALADDASRTHYYFPRRWIVPPGDRYICVPPHWPDFMLRMMRNRVQNIRRSGAIHARLEVDGLPGHLHDLFIDHDNLLVYDRSQREQKVRAFEARAPGMGMPSYYLYEDYQYQTDVVHEPPPSRGPAGPFGSPSPYCTDVRVLDLPPALVAGATYTADIEAVNRSVRPIEAVPAPAADQPNRFAAHWKSEDGRRQYFEGPRTLIAAPIAPGETRRALIRIVAPPEPGAYLLQGDVVEELVAWHSTAPGAGVHEQRLVEVVAGRDGFGSG